MPFLDVGVQVKYHLLHVHLLDMLFDIKPKYHVIVDEVNAVYMDFTRWTYWFTYCVCGYMLIYKENYHEDQGNKIDVSDDDDHYVDDNSMRRMRMVVVVMVMILIAVHPHHHNYCYHYHHHQPRYHHHQHYRYLHRCLRNHHHSILMAIFINIIIDAVTAVVFIIPWPS